MSSRFHDEKSENKYKRKYKAMKIQLREAEMEADTLAKKLAKYDKTLRELQFERSILLEKLHEVQNGSPPISDATSVSEEEAIVEKTAIKAKPEKDPNAPKRPANAFFMFCQLERGKLREVNQDASLSELTKMLGLRWKDMSADEKQVYYDMYETDKLRYEKEMSSYAGPGTGPMPLRLEDEEIIDAPVSMEAEEIVQDSQDEESGSGDSSSYSDDSS